MGQSQSKVFIIKESKQRKPFFRLLRNDLILLKCEIKLPLTTFLLSESEIEDETSSDDNISTISIGGCVNVILVSINCVI